MKHPNDEAVFQLTSLPGKNRDVWRLLRLIESLTREAVQHVRGDSRAAVLRLGGDKT